MLLGDALLHQSVISGAIGIRQRGAAELQVLVGDGIFQFIRFGAGTFLESK